MNISEQELIAIIDDFVAAMQGQGVGATEVSVGLSPGAYRRRFHLPART